MSFLIVAETGCFKAAFLILSERKFLAMNLWLQTLREQRAVKSTYKKVAVTSESGLQWKMRRPQGIFLVSVIWSPPDRTAALPARAFSKGSDLFNATRPARADHPTSDQGGSP
jgi:hypothetical protein